MQFGFKPAHSTSMCTFVLKETLSYYTQNDSSVYCVLLDASKAFDRISYTKLFNCLIDRNLPAIVIRFLINLYTDQSMCVKWIASRSSSFAVYNGVKQGAISSPVLTPKCNFVSMGPPKGTSLQQTASSRRLSYRACKSAQPFGL